MKCEKCDQELHLICSEHGRDERETGPFSAGLEGLQISDEMLGRAMIMAVRWELLPNCVTLDMYEKQSRGMREVLKAALKAA